MDVCPIAIGLRCGTCFTSKDDDVNIFFTDWIAKSETSLQSGKLYCTVLSVLYTSNDKQPYFSRHTVSLNYMLIYRILHTEK